MSRQQAEIAKQGPHELKAASKIHLHELRLR